jgi:putative phosphonate metabolism protein
MPGWPAMTDRGHDVPMSIRSMPEDARYALYYAPPPDAALWDVGSTWLGRDAVTGAALPRPPVSGFSQARLAEIIADAARYGLHATLKPPFVLAAGHEPEALRSAVADFAARRRPFVLPKLEVGTLGGFLALLLSEPSAEIRTLADDAVRGFDRFRAPATATETAARRDAGLTGRQERLLADWGYPYVFEEWRFHVTLSCRLDDGERTRLAAALRTLFALALSAPATVDGICLFRQESRSRPFRLIDRFAFTG